MRARNSGAAILYGVRRSSCDRKDWFHIFLVLIIDVLEASRLSSRFIDSSRYWETMQLESEIFCKSFFVSSRQFVVEEGGNRESLINI